MRAVLCCAVLCCAVLCCAALCCAVLCLCVVLSSVIQLHMCNVLCEVKVQVRNGNKLQERLKQVHRHICLHTDTSTRVQSCVF